MRNLKPILLRALVATALLGIADAALAQETHKYTVEPRTMMGKYAGGEFKAGAYRTADNRPDVHIIDSRARNHIRVKLFSREFYLYEALADARGIRHRTGGQNSGVMMGGYIKFMGNSVVNIPDTWGAANQYDIGLDQTKPSGTITFFSAAGSVPVGPFWVDLALSLKGRVDVQITSWGHIAANARQNGQSDFALTAANVKPVITARGSATVLSVGVYGEVKPIEGSVGPIANTQRYFIPNTNGNSTLFYLQANAPATVNLFAGELGVTAFGLDAKVISWGAPWSFSTDLFPPERIPYWYVNSGF